MAGFIEKLFAGEISFNEIDKEITKATFSDKQAAELLRDMFRDMQEGLIMSEILQDMALLPNPAVAACSSDILRNIQAGKTFSSSAEGWFSPTLQSALSVAERSDNFPELGIQVIETLIENQQDVMSDLVGKLALPFFYILMITAFMIYLLDVFFPVLDSLVERDKWNSQQEFMYAYGNFVKYFWWLIICGLTVFVIAVQFTFTHWSGDLRGKIDTLPLWKHYLQVQGSRVLMQLGILMAAGESIRRAITDISSRERPHIRWYLTRVLERVDAGYQVSRALDVGLFSTREIIGLKRREKQRSFANAVIEISKRSSEERVKTLKFLANIPMFALYLGAAYMVLQIYTGMRVEVNAN